MRRSDRLWRKLGLKSWRQYYRDRWQAADAHNTPVIEKNGAVHAQLGGIWYAVTLQRVTDRGVDVPEATQQPVSYRGRQFVVTAKRQLSGKELRKLGLANEVC